MYLYEHELGSIFKNRINTSNFWILNTAEFYGLFIFSGVSTLLGHQSGNYNLIQIAHGY